MKDYMTIYETRHQQRTITNPINEAIEVDEGLADFLLRLWEEGYVTRYSCQETLKGIPYIMFVGRENADRFIENYGGSLSPLAYNNNGFVVDGFDIL